MREFKSAFDLFRAFMPVIYFGGLLAYFLWVSGGSLENINMLGLGPTLLGLGAIGLFFCIPLAIKLVRLFGGPRSPGSGGRPDEPDDGGFDPDAAIARYMASQRSSEPTPARPAPPPAYKGGAPAARPGFGRRSK